MVKITRRWLGAAEDRFDIAVAVLSCGSTSEFLAQNLAGIHWRERDPPVERAMESHPHRSYYSGSVPG